MDNAALADMLVEHEGLRLKLYKDSLGIESIGVGRNIRDVGISRAEAFIMLDHDIATVIRGLDRELPWWKDMNEVRQRVLADMCFNMGLAVLLTFKRTLQCMRLGDYSGAAVGMLQSLWAEQVGARARRLARMMQTGLFVALTDV